MEALYIIVWFLGGILTAAYLIVTDLRGKEFNENYFSTEVFFCTLIVIAFGLISAVILIGSEVHEKKAISKILYKLANIGYNKN